MSNHCYTSFLALFLVTIFCAESSQLCNSTDYAKYIAKKLEILIGDTYSIIPGKLIWVHNNTKWANNPSGIYGAYLFDYSTGLTTYDGSPDIIIYPHDAILAPICSPPLAHYYSVASYLFNRYESNKQSPKWLFSSLGASLNHLGINTYHGANNNNTFNELVNIIHTADKKTFKNINAALNDIVNISNLNLQSIPTEYFQFPPYHINNTNFLTYSGEFDSFMALWRIAIPINEQQFNQYTFINQTVFYLKYLNSSSLNDTEPYINYQPFVRNTSSPRSINEYSLYLKDFNQYVNDLISYITETYNYEYIWNNTFIMDDCYGYCCINQRSNCLGDNRDCVYSVGYPPNQNSFTVIPNNSYIVVGVNSYLLNLTLYQNIDYDIKGTQSGVKDKSSNYAVNNFQFQDSVLNLNIPTNVRKNSLEKFYVTQFASPTTWINGIPGFNITNTTVHIGAMIRYYLNPATDTRPDENQLINSFIIKFEANTND